LTLKSRIIRVVSLFTDFLIVKCTPRNIITAIFVLTPFSIGPLPLNYLLITWVANFFLFVIYLPKILNYQKTLKKKYSIPIIWFSSSFFVSMIFGLPYKNMLGFTDFNSSFEGVFSIVLMFVPMQIIFIFMVYLSINDIKDIKYYLKVMLASGVLVNFIGFGMLISSGFTPGKLGVTFGDPNYLGRFEVFMLVICAFLIFFSPNLRAYKKNILVMFAITCIIFLLLSFSRAAILSVGFISVITLFYIKSRFLKIAVAISTVLLVFLLLSFVASTKSSDLLATNQFGIFSSFIDLSNATRIALNVASVNMFIDYPIFGIGFRNFYNAYINYSYVPFDIPVSVAITVVHSWFFSVIGEQGLFGIIPLLWLLFSLNKDLRIILKDDKIDREFYVISIIVYFLFVTLIFNGFFNPVFFTELAFSTIAGLVGGVLKVYTLKYKMQSELTYQQAR